MLLRPLRVPSPQALTSAPSVRAAAPPHAGGSSSSDDDDDEDGDGEAVAAANPLRTASAIAEARELAALEAELAARQQHATAAVRTHARHSTPCSSRTCICAFADVFLSLSVRWLRR